MIRFIVGLAVVHLGLQFAQAESNITLVGGKTKYEGRVEVFYNGSWGTVCDDKWDLVDANVVCRSLGFPNATSAPYKAPFGPGSGPIWMDDVQCLGSESSLLECPHRGFGEHDCKHKEDASVACGYAPLSKITITSLTGEITSPGYPNGTDRANNEWVFKPSVKRPLAALYFEELDLSRSNRGVTELSVKNSKNVTVMNIKNVKRKPRSGWIVKDPWMVNFHSLFTMKYRDGYNGRGFRLRYFIFSGLDDKDSCISHWDITIVAGVGAFDISWKPITNLRDFYYFVMYNATAKDVIQNFTMVTNGTSVRINHLRTDTLYSIQLIGLDPTGGVPARHSCVKIIKTKKASWRLVGGKQNNEGVVQTNYDDKWGTICALGWDIKDATVACRTLGLPPATYAITDTTHFEVNERQSWLSSLRCAGNERSLVDCPHLGWGNLLVWCRRHNYIAGVMCGYPNVTKIELTSNFGVITSPGYPRYMEQAHYEWTLKPSIQGASVVVYFEDINLVRFEPAISNLTMTDSNGKQLLFVQNRKRPSFSYRFSKTPSKIVFYSSFTSGRPTKGFRMFYLVLDNPQEYLKENWTTSARSTSPYSITVRWSAFNSNNMNLIAYLITHEAKSKPGTVLYSIADANSTALVINNLVGYFHYKVQVSAYLRDNNGRMHMYKDKPFDVQTLEGVPVRYPSNIVIEYIDFRYVHIKWNPIPREFVHGNLLGYNVYYQDYARTSKKTTITTPANHLYTVLANLLPAMKYHLQIAGYTAKGQGRLRYLSFLTRCGNVIQDKLAGLIPIPSISMRQWKVECEWTLKPRYGGALIVVMVDMTNLKPWYYPCSQMNVELINDHNRTVDKFCLRRQSVSLVSYKSAKVRFHSASALPLKREAALKVSYLVFRKGFEEVQLYSDWKITVTNHNSSTINVQWDRLPKIGGKYFKLIAVCIPDTDAGADISAGSTNGSATSVQVANLKDYTAYTVLVVAFLGDLKNIDRKRGILRSKKVMIRTLKKDWNPRYPFEHDKQNAVRMMVKGIDVLLWNQLYDHTFKETLAREVTRFCSTDKRCPSPKIRAKRSIARYIIFTSEQVHFLPGYPMQTSYANNPKNMIADLAFYLKFPAESGMNSNDTLSRSILLEAVKASVGAISKAINKTILSVSTHRRATTATPKAQMSHSKAAVIGGSVAAVIIVIVIATAVFVIISRSGNYNIKKDDEQPVIEMRHSEAGPDEAKQQEERAPPMTSHENQLERKKQEEQQEQPKKNPGQPGDKGDALETRGLEMDI